MASFFKLSCAVYWLIWIFCISWAFGMSFYEFMFVHHSNKEYFEATLMAKSLCYALSCYCFVGCIFVKCDFSHLICVACYTIPLLLVIPGFCIYGITFLDPKSSEHFFLNHKVLLQSSKEFYAKHNRVPIWLERAEKLSSCCGIHSYRDYQLHFYPASGKFPQEIDINETSTGLPVFVDDPDVPVIITPKKIPREVPMRCCAYYDRGVNFISKITDQSRLPTKHCFVNLTRSFSVLRGDKEGEAERVPLEPHLIDMYRMFLKNENFPFLRNWSATNPFVNVPMKGCAFVIMDQNKAAVNMNSYIFYILLACSLLMLLVYLRNWFEERRYLGDHSEHSLDMEDVSLIELPKRRSSTTTMTNVSIKPRHSLAAASLSVPGVGISGPRRSMSLAIPGQPGPMGVPPGLPGMSAGPTGGPRKSGVSLRRGTLY